MADIAVAQLRHRGEGLYRWLWISLASLATFLVVAWRRSVVPQVPRQGRLTGLLELHSLRAHGSHEQGPSIGTVPWVQTSHSNGNRLTWQQNLVLQHDFEFKGAVVDINTSSLDQELLGFGGAFTEATAVTLAKLSPRLQDTFFEQYFGEEGLGYTLGRVHINSCDFSLNSYSFDDVQGDYDLSHFDWTLAHDINTLIPLIHQAKAKVEHSHPGALQAHRPVVGDLEKFTVSHYPHSLVSLKAWTGKYVTVERNGAVHANRDLAQDWEKFHLEQHDDATVSIKTFFNKYFVAQSDGSIKADAENITQCAKFVKIANADGTMSLRSCFRKFAAAGRGQSLSLLATPWSPPGWMKTNRKMTGSGEQCLRNSTRATWAKYITKWIAAYKAHKIPIWGLSVQNEPTNNAPWEACVMTAKEEASFVGDHLGPAMREVHPEVNLLMFDDQKHMLVDWAREVLQHPGVAKYVDGAAFHWYSGDWFDQVASTHGKFPNLLLLASEATYEKRMWQKNQPEAYSDWGFGEGYAHDIIGDLNAGAVGWIDWNLLLEETGGPNHVGNVCDATMIADSKRQELALHPQYYYIGHFSKFILPGSRHIKTTVISGGKYATSTKPGPYGTCTGEDGLEVTSFLRPDNQVATVVLNCAAEEIEFKLRLDGRAAVKAAAPPHTIQTYLLPSVQRSGTPSRFQVSV